MSIQRPSVPVRYIHHPISFEGVSNKGIALTDERNRDTAAVIGTSATEESLSDADLSTIAAGGHQQFHPASLFLNLSGQHLTVGGQAALPPHHT